MHCERFNLSTLELIISSAEYTSFHLTESKTHGDSEIKQNLYLLVVVEGNLSNLHVASFLEIVCWRVDDGKIILLVAYSGCAFVAGH